MGEAEERRVRYPFTAIVGMEKAKKALLAVAVDPAIGGVLLAGDKGTGKTTLVRGLAQLLPPIPVAKGCPFNCNPYNPLEMCDRHYEEWRRRGRLEVEYRPMRVIDLPLNITVDRLVGSIDVEKALREGRVVFRPGLLAEANRNILYIDEVNLLDDYIADLLLDAAATGWNTVEREGFSFRHPARFILVGSMNPEEGELRPQLLDRFGLYVEVEASRDPEERMEIVRRVEEFHRDPIGFYEKYRAAEEELRRRIIEARRILPEVRLGEGLLRLIAETTVKLGIRTHRADIVVAKTAKALAALEGSRVVEARHVKEAMELALPHRLRSKPFERPSTQRVREAIEEAMEHGDPPPRSRGEPHEAPGGGGGRGGGLEMPPSSTRAPEPRGFERRRERTGPRSPGWSRSRRLRMQSPPGGRGQPVDARPPRPGGPLGDVDLYATLRAALSRGSRRPGPWDVRVRVREVRAPVLHLVLLDASGSMYAANRISIARRIVEEIAERSYVERSPVTLIVFQGRGARVLARASRNYTALLDALAHLRVGGSTPLPHALLEAYREAVVFLRRHPGSRIVLHIITDGRANVPLWGSVKGDVERAATLLAGLRPTAYIYEAQGRGLRLYSLNPLLARLLGAETVSA